MKKLSHFTLAACLLAAGSTALRAAVYLQEDFNNKLTQDLVDLGWSFNKNEFAKETGTDFGIASFPFEPANFPSGKRPGAGFSDPATGLKIYGPPGANGIASALTDVEGAGFLISDSDAAGGSDDIGSKSEFNAITAPFSTLGSGPVWFHADMAYEANNNGECIMDMSVSVDGGETWIPFFQNAEPQRAVKSYARFAGGAEPDYDGSLPIGGWPVIGSGSLTKSWNGLHGRVHFALPQEASNKREVRLKVRFFEPADAWWIAMDNLLIDNVPAPTGSTVVLDEKFDNGIPSSWSKTTSGSNSWGTEPARDADGNFFRRFTYKDVDGNDVIQYVNIDLIREAQSRIASGTNITIEALMKLDNQSFLEFPDLRNTNPSESKLDGRFMLSLAGGKYAIRSDTTDTGEVNDLDTPKLNLTGAKEVYLAFDSEALLYSGSTRYEVQVSTDAGATFEQVFTYNGGLMDLGEAASFTRHHVELPQAAGKAGVVVRFHAAGGDSSSRGFWVIDNVSITSNPSGAAPIALSAAAAGGKVNLSWTGGQGPFTLQKKAKLSDNWANVATLDVRSATVDAEGAAGFFRVIE